MGDFFFFFAFGFEGEWGGGKLIFYFFKNNEGVGGGFPGVIFYLV